MSWRRSPSCMGWQLKSFKPQELDYHDFSYEVTIAVRAVKPAAVACA